MGVLGLAQFIFIAAAVAPPIGGAPVRPNASAPRHCQLVGGDKLPGVVPPGSICKEISRAMAKQAPGAAYSVDVQILSSSRISAVLTLNGRALPKQNMAVSDGELGPRAIHRFAESLARIAAGH